MNQYSNITPKWGKNRYNLWSCESLEYQDSEKEKFILALSSDPNSVSFGQMRKFNKIACMDCKHYITGQCPFPKEEINQIAKKYKVLKPKCSVCNLPLSFHHFLLQKHSKENLCVRCKEEKINGTLKKRKKKLINSKIWVICQGIVLCGSIFIPFMEELLNGVLDLGDYIFIGLISLIFIGYLSYYLIKRRKRKKIEEGN